MFANVNIVGVVFSASGIWEYNISNPVTFNPDSFKTFYETTFPIDVSGDFMEEWSARSDFPSYFMEIQKPRMLQGSFKIQDTHLQTASMTALSHDSEVSNAVKLFNANGVTLTFYPYVKFGVKPQELMLSMMMRWSETLTHVHFPQN